MLRGWDINPNCSRFGSNNGNKTSALTLCHPPMCVFMVPEQGRSRGYTRLLCGRGTWLHLTGPRTRPALGKRLVFCPLFPSSSKPH